MFAEPRHRLALVLLIPAWLLCGCGGGGSHTVSTYLIAGTVSGLDVGAQVAVQNNGGDSTTITSNGPFKFGTRIVASGSYAVTVAVQPSAQTCTVSGGTGSNVTMDVAGIRVTCSRASVTVIHHFNATPDGLYPRGQLVKGSDGNFYGVTYGGGLGNLGTVFKLTPAGVETVLHSFVGGYSDGSFPSAALIQASDGNLYGTTANGGPTGDGTVFVITPAGTETVLHAFTGVDGISPFAALVQGGDGNFYGTTYRGGLTDRGTVFEITPAGVETVLHEFAGGTDGMAPYAALLQASDGNFYGVTTDGGQRFSGTIFKMTPSGVYTLLYAFSGADGAAPNVALTLGSDSDLYGATSMGGASGGGTIFRLTLAGVVTVLHSFLDVGADARSPVAPLLQATDGNFYGISAAGGTSNNGALFKVSPSGAETVVHSFSGGGDDGGDPSSLMLGVDGYFYGTTVNGGLGRAGTMFRF